MKKIISIFLVIVLSLSLFVGCGKKAEEGVFLIGGSGPLSGENASYGISVKQGAEIAIEEINANGGVKVGSSTYQLKLKFEDDEAKEDKAVTAYNALMDAGVNAILGNVTSGATAAIIDLTKEDGILQLTPSGSAEGLTKHDNAFRICFTDPLQGKTMADFAVNNKGYKTAALIYNSGDTYSTGVMEAFVTQYQDNGGEIIAKESFVEGDVDFTTQLTSIKDKNPDVIFVPAYYQAAAYITTQASELGMNIPFLGSDGWDGVIDKIVDTSVLEGAIFLSPFFANDTQENTVTFVEKYNEKFKVIPDQFAADGYDGVYVIAAAMEKAGSIKSEDLIAAMTQISVKGVTGDMAFTADGEPDKGAKFIVIENGEYKINN